MTAVAEEVKVPHSVGAEGKGVSTGPRTAPNPCLTALKERQKALETEKSTVVGCEAEMANVVAAKVRLDADSKKLEEITKSGEGSSGVGKKYRRRVQTEIEQLTELEKIEKALKAERDAAHSREQKLEEYKKEVERLTTAVGESREGYNKALAVMEAKLRSLGIEHKDAQVYIDQVMDIDTQLKKIAADIYAVEMKAEADWKAANSIQPERPISNL